MSYKSVNINCVLTNSCQLIKNSICHVLWHIKVTGLCSGFPSIDTFTWEEIKDISTKDSKSEANGTPAVLCGHAGHTAAVLGTRMYVWSGRIGYNRMCKKKVGKVWSEYSSPPPSPPNMHMKLSITQTSTTTHLPSYTDFLSLFRKVSMICGSWRQRSLMPLLVFNLPGLALSYSSYSGPMCPLVSLQK